MSRLVTFAITVPKARGCNIAPVQAGRVGMSCRVGVSGLVVIHSAESDLGRAA